jgi:hypothetical protein
MEDKNTRRWQLQDILHSIGEPGITQSDYGDANEDAMQARNDPYAPELIGKIVPFDLAANEGLPECMSEADRSFMYRAIRKATTGAVRTLEWTLPITCTTQLKTSLEDQQVDDEDDRRYQTVILRAQPKFQNRPACDNVKVWIQEDAGKRLYFAKYVYIMLI